MSSMLEVNSQVKKSDTVPWVFVALAFSIVLLDGFDTATLAFAIPVLSKQWEISPSSFSTALVLTNVGVVLGYIGSGALSAKISEKQILVWGGVLFGVFTIISALAISSQSMTFLSFTRLLTGVGLGGVLPVAVSLAASHAPSHLRQRISVFVTLGLTSGLSLGGFLGGFLMREIGVTGVFVLAGVLPIVVSGLLALVKLPEKSLGHQVLNKKEVKFTRLFQQEYKSQTLLLWVFSFLVFLVAYTITNWAPTLLNDYGFDQYTAPLGLAMFSLGGLVGGIFLIPLAAKLGIERALVIMPTIGIIALVSLVYSEGMKWIVFSTLFVAGAGITSSQIGQLTMAVNLYPEEMRSTGVGWSAALGRMGSIIGPAVGGVLIEASFSASTIMGIATVPILLALLAAFSINLINRKNNNMR